LYHRIVVWFGNRKVIVWFGNRKVIVWFGNRKIIVWFGKVNIILVMDKNLFNGNKYIAPISKKDIF